MTLMKTFSNCAVGYKCVTINL